MADKKEFVKLWLSYESYFASYSDAEVGRLVRGMISYRATREQPVFGGNERFVWPAIQREIDEQIAALEAISTARSQAGKSGGRRKRMIPTISRSLIWFLIKSKKANAF